MVPFIILYNICIVLICIFYSFPIRKGECWEYQLHMRNCSFLAAILHRCSDTNRRTPFWRVFGWVLQRLQCKTHYEQAFKKGGNYDFDGKDAASGAHLDLIRAPYVLYGVKYIDPVSLAPFSGQGVRPSQQEIRKTISAWREARKCPRARDGSARTPVNLKSVHNAPFFSKWRKIWIWDVFWSQHLRCFGQNTSRIQNKEVYATLCLQANCHLKRRWPLRHWGLKRSGMQWAWKWREGY